INHAIAQARTDDLVLIAGKGHEDYQIIGREVFHLTIRKLRVRHCRTARSSQSVRLRRLMCGKPLAFRKRLKLSEAALPHNSRCASINRHGTEPLAVASG